MGFGGSLRSAFRSSIGGGSRIVEDIFKKGTLIGMASEREKRRKKKKKESAEAAAASERARREEERKRLIAEQSTRAQAEKQRRRTVFAGSPITEATFRRTLGGGSGAETLG